MSPSILPFTPGPWFPEADRVTALDVTYRQDEVTIAWLPEPDAEGNFPEAGVRAGNARLIAAAPDLLDQVAWAATTLAAAVQTLLDPLNSHRKGLRMTDQEPTEAPPLTPAALGIDWVYHNPGLDRFPWQVALTDARVVLLSADLTQSVVLPSGGDIRQPHEPHELPTARLPQPVLAAVRTAIERADRDELAELLHRRRQIAQFWGVADVTTVRPDLSDEQAWAVLQRVDQTQGATLGITWESIERAAAELFGHGPDADDDDDDC